MTPAPRATPDPIAVVDALLASAPADRRDEALLWSLWGTPPWHGWQGVVRALLERVVASDTLPPALREVATLAAGRAMLAARRAIVADEALGEALPRIIALNRPALTRVASALIARARLRRGHATEAFAALEPDAPTSGLADPPDLAFETSLTLGVLNLVSLRLADAAEAFERALSQASSHDRAELAAWQAAHAAACLAATRLRQGELAAARPLLALAKSLAQDADAGLEWAEWALSEAALSLASGALPDAPSLQAVLARLAASPRETSLDFPGGFPVALSGAATPDELKARLVTGATERADALDMAGSALCGLAWLAVSAACDPSPAEAATLAREMADGHATHGRPTLAGWFEAAAAALANLAT